MATYSLYQARQFSLKSRWVLYPWQNVSSFLFFTIIFQYENWFAIFFLRDPNSLGRKRPRASFRSWNRRPKSNSWDNTGSRFLETTNFFHFKGGPGNWSVPPREREIRIRDKNNSAMLSRSLRVIHRESMCIERIIVSEMKILSIYYCYLRATLYLDLAMVEDRGTNFAWEMDSFSRRRLKYNFLVRKLRWLVCKFHDSTGDYSDIRMIRSIWEYASRYWIFWKIYGKTYFHLIELREREREENSIIILNMERKRNLNIKSEFQLIDNFNIFQL